MTRFDQSQSSPITLELEDIQATVLRVRPVPYYGTHVMLRIDDARGGRELLQRLTPHVTSASNWRHADEAWLAVTLSYPGLVALGVPDDSLRSFPESFRQGMAGRAPQLCDQGENAPQHWEAPFGTGQIHVALSGFSGSEAQWREVMQTARAQFEGLSGVTHLFSQDFGAQPGGLNSLGYKDGIGQPVIDGSDVEPFPGQGAPIKAGEFILGYPNEAGSTHRIPQPEILGRNGVFVGLRKYVSRVGEFKRFLTSNAKTADEQELLAAKLVGRWRSGAPLVLAPERDDPALGADFQRNNDFSFRDDPRGLRAPLGCHMRRMNPRDTKLAVLTDVNLHRIIRRGTTYGPEYDPVATAEQDDAVERGVYFIFMGARAMETIEFLQSEWINNGTFLDLGAERDPIVGLQDEEATFTIPRQPVRRRIHGIHTFNQLRGGEYLFMPSLSALRWLAALQD